MILDALYQLYSRLEQDSGYGIAPPGFSPQKISFRIVLKPDGTLHAFEDARQPDEKGRPQSVTKLVPGAGKPSGSGINPCFLWDDQRYLLGRLPEDKKNDPEQRNFGRVRFERFRTKHLFLQKEINDPEFDIVCVFLQNWRPEMLAEHPLLNELIPGFGVFQILGNKKEVHESPGIRNWWLAKLREECDKTPVLGRCLITGERTGIARLHPAIKGVAGAQSSGAPIVCVNKTAGESYRKKQGFNSPVGEDAAFRYGTALNALLNGPKSARHRLSMPGTTTVFWTEEPTVLEDFLGGLLTNGSEAAEQVQDQVMLTEIRLFMEAIRQGGAYRKPGLASTKFYLLGLAPNAGRVSVRFFHRSSVADLVSNLHRHFKDLEIIRQFTEKMGNRGPDLEFPGIYLLLKQTAFEAKGIPPLFAGALTRAIVDGLPYPEEVFSSVLRRIRADRWINHPRVAILKATLIRNHQQSITVMLDRSNTDPAYLLGRLFAVFEKTQEDALGQVNSGLRDSFYGGASATPCVVFPRLFRTYQHHLAKLVGGSKVAREKLVQDIMAPLDGAGFPKQLTLQQQGLFAIGYYHQRKDFFTKKDAAEPKETEES